MRILYLFAALLPLSAAAHDHEAREEIAPIHDPAEAPPFETIVVTAEREPREATETPASVSRIEGRALEELSAKHSDEILNRSAGVYFQHGSGQESLGAIRSPVLSGPGACGAFLMAEDSLPIRPVGFCNLNEMFEVNFEQAAAVEVLRGPGSALYGASAVHGIVNVLTPDVTALDAFGAGFEGGADSFKRARLTWSNDASDGVGFGLYGSATRAPGWRDASGVDEAKLNLLGDFAGVAGGALRVRAAGTVLNQETAGFIQGFDAYRDRSLARTNANPEAFRDASSARVSASYRRDDCGTSFEVPCLEIAAIYRRSRMDFLQHFLIGKPLEHNAQTSALTNASYLLPISGTLRARFAADAELARSELTEFQAAPATDGAPAANAIRPAGYHYDYVVDSNTLGASVGLEWKPIGSLTAAAAMRIDRTVYDYDNRMLAGNTRDDGTACGANGCLYARPAARRDTFDNVAPRITLSWQADSRTLLYLSASRGFRPPEMTEMYRLQRQQTVADLDSEQLDAAELGWKFDAREVVLSASLYAMNKRHVILRDSNGFNVSNGSTGHRGIEYEAQWRPVRRLRLYATGTYARHEYTFSRAIEGGEIIVDGNDVDTAPRQLHNLGIEADLGKGWRAALDGSYVGRYFLDAANTTTYPGHEVANARVSWELPMSSTDSVRAVLRIDNLFDRAYADRADFAFGNYRYFPAQGRAVYLSFDYDQK
jgi:outer membrane receptor protein involved in Fe transport